MSGWMLGECRCGCWVNVRVDVGMMWGECVVNVGLDVG